MARATTKRTAARRAKRPPHRPAEHDRARNRAFWSGTLSFGLVNVPVLVFPASRHSGVRLRLMSPDGRPLERRFFCPSDGKEAGSDELLRGYELDDGSYVTVTDRELEEIEPRKTREIDLRAFVDLAEISPAILERGYYLTPAEGTTKAYRLLADAMERTGRAGIATFVMREREYLVAIFAREGILCAETLRFHDELRDPKLIGIYPIEAPERQRVSRFERAINALSAKSIRRAELADRDTKRLKALIAKKHRAGRDIVRAEPTVREPEPDGEAEVDLLETIRMSLRRSRDGVGTHRLPTKPSHNSAGAASERKVSARIGTRNTVTAFGTRPRRIQIKR
jgi:DNA end-binding protein Ku